MGTYQILLFGMIAVKIKAVAPGAHTFPEIVLARHGRVAHLSYLFFGLATNLLVGACLVLGGAQVVSAVTSMNVYGACFLIPLVVAAYVIVGGLRSTFIADYVHSLVLFLAIFIFGFLMYATSPAAGSPLKFYTLLEKVSEVAPISGNAHGGSYLTFRSVDGLVFAIDLLVAGFSTVWLDQAYWQRAIASRPESSLKAYLWGGIAWYGIPFGFGTIAGLGCAALTGDPAFPTYPNPLSKAQVGAGLSAPATAITLLGQGGAVLMLILLFMAVTSSTSAELIAVSSLLTFDVYKTYVAPQSSSHRLVQVSHYGIVMYGLVLAAFCSILNAVGVNLTWLLTVLGIIVAGASMPVGLVLLWPRMSTLATVLSPWLALALGLVSWFVTTAKLSGAINVDSTGLAKNAVAGNVVSWGAGLVLAVIFTLVFPKHYVSDNAQHIDLANKIQGITTSRPVGHHHEASRDASPTTASLPKRDSPSENNAVTSSKQSNTTDPEKEPSSSTAPEAFVPTGNALVDYLETQHVVPLDNKVARNTERFGWAFNTVYGLIAIILVPFSLFGTGYLFSVRFFTGWVVVSFMWVWASFVICVILPLVESRREMLVVAKGVWRDLGGLTQRR